MRVRVLQKAYYYDRRMYEIGEELDMDDREDGNVAVLATLGQLEIVEPTKRSGVGYRTAAMKAQPEAKQVEPEPEQQQAEDEQSTAVGPMTAEGNPLVEGNEPKKYYRRRDMRAEK
jgi:hypothetical protein